MDNRKRSLFLVGLARLAACTAAALAPPLLVARTLDSVGFVFEVVGSVSFLALGLVLTVVAVLAESRLQFWALLLVLLIGSVVFSVLAGATGI